MNRQDLWQLYMISVTFFHHSTGVFYWEMKQKTVSHFPLTKWKEFPEYRFVHMYTSTNPVQHPHCVPPCSTGEPFHWKHPVELAKHILPPCIAHSVSFRAEMGAWFATLPWSLFLSKQTFSEEWMGLVVSNGAQESKTASEEVIICRHSGQSVRKFRVMFSP